MSNVANMFYDFRQAGFDKGLTATEQELLDDIETKIIQLRESLHSTPLHLVDLNDEDRIEGLELQSLLTCQ